MPGPRFDLNFPTARYTLGVTSVGSGSRMKVIAALVVMAAAVASPFCVAQTPKAGARQQSADTIYSWCVTRFDAESQHEVFVTTLGVTGDTISMKRFLEYRARTGANSSIQENANLSTECGSSRDKADALKRRDLKKGEATNLGYQLKPEVTYY